MVVGSRWKIVFLIYVHIYSGMRGVDGDFICSGTHGLFRRERKGKT